MLICFRKEAIPFTADIEGMFHQIKVPKQDRSFLRFLWWENGNINGPVVDFEMCVHTFGAISSPSCANFTLKYNAENNRKTLGNDAASTILRNFYVDDLLKSSKTEIEAVSLLRRVKESCSNGGFNLTKVVSNSKRVVESVPDADRSPVMQQVDIDKFPQIESALGVTWYVTSDELGFRINMTDSPLTRRGILSTISSIFDVLGLVSPFLLKGRKILQEITADKHDWDDEVQLQHRVLWEEWRRELYLLNSFKVVR